MALYVTVLLACWGAACLVFGLVAVFLADMAVEMNRDRMRQWRERHRDDYE